MSARWLESLLPWPVQRGGRQPTTGFLSEGVTVRPFTRAELAAYGRGFVEVRPDRTFEVLLDSESLGSCPVARYLVALHESGHVLAADTAPGRSAQTFAHGDRRIQERAAWSFTAGAAQKILTREQTAHCLSGCVGAEPPPDRCTQPDLPGLLERITERAPAMAVELAAAVTAKPAWFGEASGLPARTAESLRIRDCAGGICGPAEGDDERMLEWVSVESGEPVGLRPDRRIWSADW